MFGISILDEAKARFAKKFDVTFPLLADADHEVAEMRSVAAEITLWPQIHGERPHDVSHRRQRKSRATVGQREVDGHAEDVSRRFRICKRETCKAICLANHRA